MVTQHFGSVAASTVRGFGAEQYPLLLVAMKNRSAMEICSVLQGTNYCCFFFLFKCESGNEGLPAFRELVSPKLSRNVFFIVRTKCLRSDTVYVKICSALFINITCQPSSCSSMLVRT